MAICREICKICYHANSIGFKVPDKVWKSVTPLHLWDNILCLACFTRLADEKLVRWDNEIEFFPVSMITHVESAQR